MKCITRIATVAVLAFLPAALHAAPTPLPWCDSEQPANPSAPAPAPPPQSALPLPTRTGAQAATDGQTLSSSANLDAFLDRLSKENLTPEWKAQIRSLKSHTLREKAKLGADVESLTGAHAPAEIATLSGQQVNDTARVIDERDWLATSGTRLDPRVVEGALGAPPATLSANQLSERQEEIANLAGLYPQGAQTMAPADAGQSEPETTSFTHLRQPLPLQDRAQMDPGTNTAPGALHDVKPNTPVVLNEPHQCIRKATQADWKPDPTTHALPILFDPLGFPEVGLLLRRTSGTSSSATFKLCSFTLIRSVFALTAAHCVYAPNSDNPDTASEIAGLRDAHQTLALLPLPTSGTRNPTKCFDSPATADCRFVVAAVTAVFVPDNFHWPRGNQVPDQDIAILQIGFRGAPDITPANLVFTVPAERRITLAGYGLTTDPLVASRGAFLVGWQDIDAVTQYGLRWVPTALGRTSNPCPGDSGGPIFLGNLFGVPHEKHRVTAVISRIEPASAAEASSQQCLEQPGVGVTVAGYQDWICKVIASPLEACTQ